MENCHGQHGWKEFNRNRKDILAEFDKILEQTTNRPIQVSHGQGVEAYIRKWLSEFLPKKYGVTSGYIIPDLYDDSLKIYHYDIIIFNQFDAPILWTEGNFDQSEQGKSRAIPAKNVVSVYEVKSRLTKSNITEALEKLRQTNDFKNQLNPLYTCGTIFIDLKESENNKESIIKELLKGKDITGFTGGMILRYENDHSCIGNIKLLDVNPTDEDKDQLCKPIAKPIDDLDIYLTEDNNIQSSGTGTVLKMFTPVENSIAITKGYSLMYTEGSKSVYIEWSRTNFSDFCINLISALEGLAYNDKNRPSFGKIFDTLKLKKSPLQGPKPVDNHPFIELILIENEGFKINLDSSKAKIKFSISIENKGNVGAIISTDSFKSQIPIPMNEKIIIHFDYDLVPIEGEKNIKNKFKKGSMIIPYRIVYYSINSNKDFRSIEKIIRITENRIELLDE